MSDKKIRVSFSRAELQEIYMALGAVAGMMRDTAAIRDLKPSEYVPGVARITALQDRIAEAVNSKEQV